jgi:hypothetical protein
VEIISLQSSWDKNLIEKIELFKWTINEIIELFYLFQSKWKNRMKKQTH